MNMRRCLSCVLLLSVCFYVLFLPLHTVHASSYEPDIYILYYESTFSSGYYTQEESSTNWDRDFVNSDYGYFFPINEVSYATVWQNIDRLYSSGTYDVTVKYEFLTAASTPESFEFNDILLGFRTHEDSSKQINFNADNIIFTPAQNDNNAYFTATFKNVDVSFDFNRLRHFITTWVGPSNAPDGNEASMKLRVTSVSMDKVDETPGLLKGITDFVKNIWTGITELPSKILDGIKNLFIPSEEDITNMKDKWDTLLSDRFGALYQVASIISDYASSFKESNKNTITFPSVSIPLAGSTFEFGGWEVQVVPDGFGIIFDTLKLIISILATIFFINSLKNRFDKILGGADDI